VTPDAITGWDDDATAEAYAAFARTYPMYCTTSRDLAARADLADSRLVVDLCGGTGVTAQAILDCAPAHARVLSLDSSTAMQGIGRRTLYDPRLSWITAPAETLAEHVPAHRVDAVVCNSAIWKTEVPAVAPAVHTVLRPGGRFVFNIGGGFAGLANPDAQASRSSPSLDMLIHQIAAQDYGYIPPPGNDTSPKLPLAVITRNLADAGLRVVDTEVTTQHTTNAERKEWLSIPVFARPEGDLTYEQRMDILNKAYACTNPNDVTATRWLVITAQRNKGKAYDRR
jgi:SAM-dependent methyltransferase